MRPFVIDVYSVNDRNEVSRKRLGSDSLESALLSAQHLQELPSTSRIVISRRLGGGGLAKMKVWTRSMAS